MESFERSKLILQLHEPEEYYNGGLDLSILLISLCRPEGCKIVVHQPLGKIPLEPGLPVRGALWAE